VDGPCTRDVQMSVAALMLMAVGMVGPGSFRAPSFTPG